MEIGIIVHPITGHTLTVAKALEERLAADGQAVTLAQIETAERVKVGQERAELANSPPVHPYEALVFACPVHGSQMSAAMISHLEGLSSVEGKKVACLVTGAFPPFLGCNRALAHRQEACESKGATVVGSEGVTWLSFRRKRQIAEAVDSLSASM
jgi:flavodoxin